MADNFDDVSPRGVGRRLEITRSALKLSQAELCRRMSVLGSAISTAKWNNAETGDNYLPPPELKYFYQVTGASADWILFGHLHQNPESLQKAITDHLLATTMASRKPRRA